jgi:acyl transferase domain-containing protein/surfactin synthase thioesterase subunit/acyl carrier protein
VNSPQRNLDIAIVGLSCRFPGAATPEEYWSNLCGGVESITFFSDRELVAAGVDPSLVAHPSYVRAAPTLRDVELFDAAFFGYSPKDAALMDPQQRLFLEVCWEAFESAGYDPVAYPGKVGVLSTAGGVVTSYLLAKLHHADLPGQTASISHINNDKDFLSTRVCFKLNLRGPSFTIQSACSSSLVAVHQACQNLRFNECDMMLAGGSVVRVPQVAGYLAEKRNLHSLDGHCRPFDSVGQGTIFGSGVGAVLLKPLHRAAADRDHIFAVIKATAANNDGSGKSSYTAPSLGQQSQAVVDALDLAGVSADSIGYVECHSTGTIVGDPLEIEALTAAFRKGSKRNQYCAIGSVKANIGHPEQAAGIAGLIKTALVLHHKRIPPSINYETPNPAIDFESSPFYVNTNLQDFPVANTPRRAGLNSLGIGGTNAFAVLEEAPPAAARSNPPPDLFPRLVTLSAKSATALVARVQQLLDWLNENSDAPIGDVAYTTNVSRSQFAFRFAAPVRSTRDLKSHLAAWLQRVGENTSGLRATSNAPIAFMFSGQGSQHAGMAAELYRAHSVFRNAMDQCHALAEPYLEQRLLEVIFAPKADNSLVNRTDYTQPALFAVEYALAELLKSWGISPEAVIGHSLGEIVAASAAGVMTLEDAIRLVTSRGALMHRLPSGGAMASIMADESAVRPLIDAIAPEITVAAMNGPLNTVVSGERAALTMLSEELDRRGITYRELRISNGFHSPRTEPILDDLERVAGQIRYQPPRLKLISNHTGDVMSAAPDKSYWRRHLREAVRFGDGMLALAKLECRTFLEIGPHPVLLPMAQACLEAKGKSASWIATLNRQKSDAESITEMLVALYLAGHQIDWAAVHPDASWRRIPLPTYPFQRKRHWIEDDRQEKFSAIARVETGQTREAVERLHPLLGTRINSSANEVLYQARYGMQHVGYYSDHRVAGTVVLPTTAELEAATVAARTHFRTSGVSFDTAMHHQALSFANGEDRIVRIVVAPLSSEKASFRFLSAATEDAPAWTTHMTGTLRMLEAGSWTPALSIKQLRARCPHALPVVDLYDGLERLGLEYGPTFRGVRELYFGEHEALTKVQLPECIARHARYVTHPAFLDACLHAYPLVLDGAKANGGRSYLPISLAGFRCYQDGIDEAWVHTRLRNVEKDGTQLVDIRVYDQAEQPVAELDGLAVRLLPLAKLQLPQAQTDNAFYRLSWRSSNRRSARPQENYVPASWIFLADAKGISLALASRLEALGHHCHLVYRDAAFGRRGTRTWTVNERRPQDFRELLEQFTASETLLCRGVVYLWGLDASPVEGLTLATLKSGTEMMCRGALGILHALAESRSANPTGRRLWFVTTNTQSIDGRNGHVDPVQAPLWGLGRTVAAEYPGIWGGLIDLELSGPRTPDIDSLAAELLDPDGETQIAISAGGHRNVPRLVRQSLADTPRQVPRVRGDASYLVTGGLGMLGRSVAKWLMGKGAKHLVLTGRNASSQAAQELFDTAEINDAAIHVVSADISREQDVTRLIRTMRDGLPPLRGVVHSAGVLDDGILAQLDWDRFAPLFEPRVYGSWLLHEFTKALDLDFFILKSSLLSLLGSAGQANYTASSAFLDSLAAYRRAAGYRAMAINWGAWSGGGLATVSGARGQAMWSSLGLHFISPDAAMQCFDKLMHHEVDQIAVAVADWPTYAGKLGNPTFLSELLNRNDVSGSSRVAQPIVVPDASAAASNGQARQRLLSGLQQHITAKLGFNEAIDPDQPLNELGLDSLMSVNLSNSLEQELGFPVSVTELIKGPTLNQLADHLIDKFTATLPDPPQKGGLATSPAHLSTAAISPPMAAARPMAAGRPMAAAPMAAAPMAPAQLATSSWQAPDERAIRLAGNGKCADAWPVPEINQQQARAHCGDEANVERPGELVPHPAPNVPLRTGGKWLVPPRRNPNAKARLFCFPYAGGGVVSFRAWPDLLDRSVELVAVEPPGRGTRINETAVGDMDSFVEHLLPELLEWLDRPSGFFGHCLGGLTMYATLCAIPAAYVHFVKHSFACGVRPPHLLKRRGEFEDNLAYDMMLDQEFDIRLPPYAQTDKIFADIIRQFDTPAADKMLQIPKLRKALLPTIRAEFGMAYNYRYQPVEPFSFPISSFVGDLDPWVSLEDSDGWGKLTRGGFTNHVRQGSHFLMAEDREYILRTIEREFLNHVA